MRKTTLALIAILISLGGRTHAASMLINSLTGPVTSSEISSFKTFMATQTPPPTPWGTLGGTGHNDWADGTGGRDLEAMGVMFEVSGDTNILISMISWADTCVSERNDLMSAANGGQRVMWTGLIDKVWCPNYPTDPTDDQSQYCGCETEDVIGHMAFCAKLILENTNLWNTTVPDGDPFGYGATYIERATNYLGKCDEANSEYFLKWFIQPGTSLIVAPTNAAWVALNENVNANNRQMMFCSGFQRLAEAHELLGDNPGLVAQYDAIVEASVGQCLSGMIAYDPYTAKGQPVYDWGYYPTTDAPESTEIHAEYDMIGVYRAFNRAKYGLTLSPLVPFANTMVDVVSLGSGTFAANVDGSGGTTSPIYSGWIMPADWNPAVYTVVGGWCFTNGWYTSRPDIDAGILWMKNRIYLEFSVTPSTNSVTVAAGSATNLEVAVAPLGGFSGTVSLTAGGLPTGASAAFSPTSVNLAKINAASTNSTVSISTSSSTVPGSYPVSVIGTSGSVSHTNTFTLVVAAAQGFTVSATPSSQPVQVTGSTSYTVDIGSVDGFGGSVSLGVSGLPTGASGNFNPTSVTAPGSSTLNVTTSISTPANNDTLTISGTSGGVTNETTVTLAVNDFTIATTPSSQSVAEGNSTNYTVSIGNDNGFTGTVDFTASGLPSGATANFVPSSVTSIGSSTLTIATSGTTPTGSNTVTVFGTSGSLVHSNKVGLVVTGPPNFTISATPSSQTVTAGGNTTYTATITALNGFNGNVALTASGLPSGATASYNPTSVTGSGSSTLTVATTTNTPAGTNTLTLKGTSGSLTNTTTVTLVVAAQSQFTGTYEIQNVTSSQVLNQGGSLTNGSPISQWKEESNSNLEFTFIATSNGYYQINSVKSGLDVVVANAATTNNAPLIQWSFGSSGDDQWKPVQITNGTWAFYNLHSGLTLNNTGGSTNEGSQYSQWSWANSPNEEFNLIKQ
jgi:hypothetical protein